MSLEFLLPASWSSAASANYRVSQHAYKNTDRYEQSLDVYHPILLQEDDNDHSEKQVIVLVMGSGWLGHVSWIYSMTGWWNAQGPKSICSRLGYTCISIRHSGGFFHSKFLLRQAILMTVLLSSLLLLRPSNNNNNNVFYSYIYMGCLLVWSILLWQGQNAATTIDEMIDDVSVALQYVQQNSTKLGISNNSKLVIGGYSSGGHLLATYINGIKRNDIDNDDDDSKLNLDRIVGVLYLSAVFSLDNCWFVNILTYIVFGRWSWQMPSSPMTTVSDSYLVTREKQLPHLIIGCQKETFGIPILDHAFATLEYWDKIKQQQYSKSSSKCVLVPSNHWCILSSTALTDALETNIPQVFNSQTTTTTKEQQQHAGENDNDDTTTTPELRRQAEVLSSEAYTNSMNSVTTSATSANANANANADSPVPSLTNDDSDDNDNDDDMITPGSSSSSSSLDNRDGTITTTATPELHRQAEVLSSGSSFRSLTTSTNTTNNKTRKNSPTPELRRQQEVLSSFNSATSGDDQ